MGREVVNIDPAPCSLKFKEHYQHSILDRPILNKAMQHVDCAVHIAAWHGIHEDKRYPADFHDLNVTGTFNVLQAAVENNVSHFVFMSSTSVVDQYGIYGHSKLLAEALVEAYAQRHGLSCVILRPRAFIPPWNKTVYKNFIEWTEWFMKGAVHINDLLEATLLAIDHRPSKPASIYVIDGAYEYKAQELATWDAQGKGSSFAARYPEYLDIAEKYGLNTNIKPRPLEIAAEQCLPGYNPRYSLRTMLQELKDYGLQGPPEPCL